MPATPDLELTRIGQLPTGFHVRPGHPVLNLRSIPATPLLAHGLASVHIPESMVVLLTPLLGVPQPGRLRAAVECNDLNILKALAMTSDTVLACADDATLHEMAAGRLVRLTVTGLPPLFSDIGVVSL